MKYKELKTFESRCEDSKRILQKYPDRIPVILEKYDDKSPDLDRYKFLVSSEMTLAMLVLNIRTRIKLKPSEALFLTINGTLCNTSTMMKELYNTEKDKDQFLYITFSSENTFGKN